MVSEKEGKLINFDNDVVNPGDNICVHNFINESWKIATAQEIDLDDREILVQYEDRSQEWIRIDGTKICFPPPPVTATVKPTPNTSTKKSIRIQNRRIMKSRFSNKRPPSKSTKNNTENDGVEGKKLKIRAQSERKGSEITKSTASPFPKLKLVQKSEMIRHDSSSKTRKTPRTTGKNSDGDKDVTKLKIRFGKAPDLDNFLRKKNKADGYDDSHEEMSVVINDEKLPPGWSKHKVKRPNSSKWDVILQNEDEKKFRSRAEIQAYFERRNEPYPEDAFDFCSSRKPSSKATVEKSSKVDISESLPFLSNKKKIKTLLPRRSTADSLPTTPISNKEPVIDENPLKLAVTVTPFAPLSESLSSIISPGASGSSGFVCPKQDCKKQCRNSSGLIMHIRHSHKEYKSMLSSLPSVADLAYARTVGESLDASQIGFLERIAKLEENRMKEKPDADRTIIDEEFSLAIEEDGEETPPVDSTQKPLDAVAKAKVVKRSTPVKKNSSTPSSPSSSVLLAQLKQPPLVPPTISIQSECTDAEFSVSQNSPIALFSPNVSNKDLNIDKSSPLSETDDKNKKNTPSRKRRLSQLDNEDVINCICGYGFADGLMMECELCGCWQHAVCNSVESEDDARGTYICYMCQNPRRVHSSKKFSYVQNWLKEGKIPKYEFSKTADEVMEQRKKFIQQTHKFLCRLTELRKAIHGLKVKTHILRQTPDHPKLYLWAKSWDDTKLEEKENIVTSDGGPIPEAAINMVDCRKHLSEHIDEEMDKVEAMLQDIEEEIDKLEDDEDFKNDPDKLKNVAKQTLLMLMRDLSSIQNLKYCL